MTEQRWEFTCKECGGRTAIILPSEDVLNPRAIMCGYCDSNDLHLSAYYRRLEDLLSQLAREVESLTIEIERLENTDDSDQDILRKH